MSINDRWHPARSSRTASSPARPSMAAGSAGRSAGATAGPPAQEVVHEETRRGDVRREGQDASWRKGRTSTRPPGRSRFRSTPRTGASRRTHDLATAERIEAAFRNHVYSAGTPGKTATGAPASAITRYGSWPGSRRSCKAGSPPTIPLAPEHRPDGHRDGHQVFTAAAEDGMIRQPAQARFDPGAQGGPDRGGPVDGRADPRRRRRAARPAGHHRLPRRRVRAAAG